MMILEELLLDAMYTLPSQKRVKEFVITSEMVERRRAIPGEGLDRHRRRRRLSLSDKLKFVEQFSQGGVHLGNDLQLDILI